MTCEPCPTGHYCPNDAMSAAVLCINGTYQNETGQSSCAACPGGMSCLSVSGTPIDCANGTYSAIGVRECMVCPSGHR